MKIKRDKGFGEGAGFGTRYLGTADGASFPFLFEKSSIMLAQNCMSTLKPCVRG